MADLSEAKEPVVNKLIDEIKALEDALAAKKVEGLKAKSMLEQSRKLHDGLRKVQPDAEADDEANMWLRPYAETQTRQTLEKSSVWFTAYMPSVIGSYADTKPLKTLADPGLWDVFRKLHITGIHTGPVMSSGGFGTMADADRSASLPDVSAPLYPTMDGWFDPISLEIDTQLGDEGDYDALVKAAKGIDNDCIVIGDIVPGHTGLGPDFYLALKGVSPYTGLYMLVRIDDFLDNPLNKKFTSIPPELRKQLQAVEGPSRLLKDDEVKALRERRIIPGKLQREMGVQAGKGWSITGPVEGLPDRDGKTTRRWLYLHFFHPKQPTLNWVDPNYAAWRLVNGELNYMVAKLKSQGVRLDANAFLGVEVAGDSTSEVETAGNKDTWSEAHPLSEMATNMLAWQARRLGGFSFQENNMPLPSIAASAKYGPDFSYDFITRPACQHALLTGNTNLLHFMYCEMQRAGINPMNLIHALQNHDEFTYELVHLASLEGDKSAPNPDRFFKHVDKNSQFRFKDKNDPEWDSAERKALLERTEDKINCEDPPSIPSIWRRIKTEMRNKAIRDKDYTRESGNGLCTTTVGLVAASLNIPSLNEIDSKKVDIQSGHLLLAGFNAFQPGVFALSGWDLVGALPLDEKDVPKKALNTGNPDATPEEMDYRWINRGAYKLLETFTGDSLDFIGKDQRLPEAKFLYGPIDRQLSEPESFAVQLERLLAVRQKYSIATADFLGTLELEAKTEEDPTNRKLFAMVMRASTNTAHPVSMAVFNFSSRLVYIKDSIASAGMDSKLWLTQWKTKYPIGDGQWSLVYDSVTARDTSDHLERWQFRLYVLKQGFDLRH